MRLVEGEFSVKPVSLDILERGVERAVGRSVNAGIIFFRGAQVSAEESQAGAVEGKGEARGREMATARRGRPNLRAGRMCPPRLIFLGFVCTLQMRVCKMKNAECSNSDWVCDRRSLQF